VKPPQPKSQALLAGIVAIMLVFSIFLSVNAQSPSVKPEITDLTAGTPVTGSNFTVRVSVVAVNGVSMVRLYLWFRVPPPVNVTETQYIIMDAASGSEYESNVEVPLDASSLNYYITAYDLLYATAPIEDKSDHVDSTDVISWQVRDNVAPTASCTPSLEILMGETIILDASASTDNVGVTNYTWAFQYNGTEIRLYGVSAVFRFLTPGKYAGRLTAKDGWDNAGTADFAIKVLDDIPPIADAGIQIYVTAGQVTFLDGSESTDNAGISNYTWTYINNGTLAMVYGVSPPVIFWTPGLLEVTLTVSDASGNTDASTVTVNVLSPSGEQEGGIEWWVYALAAMMLAIAVLGIIIIRI